MKCSHKYDNFIQYKELNGTIHVEPIGVFVEKHLEARETEARLDGTCTVNTPNGEARITGVAKAPNKSRELIRIVFANGSDLSVTSDHVFSHNGMLITADELTVGDFIGLNIALKEVEASKEPVYGIEIDTDCGLFYIDSILTV